MAYRIETKHFHNEKKAIFITEVDKKGKAFEISKEYYFMSVCYVDTLDDVNFYIEILQKVQNEIHKVFKESGNRGVKKLEDMYENETDKDKRIKELTDVANTLLIEAMDFYCHFPNAHKMAAEDYFSKEIYILNKK